MGYDFRMRRTPTRQVWADVRTIGRFPPGTLSYNLAGMAVQRWVMIRVLADDPAPDFPARPEHVDLQDAVGESEVYEKLNAIDKATVDRVRAAEAVMLATPSRQPGKVPGFKFGSNDGWIVTPAECAIIAAELALVPGQIDQRHVDHVNASGRGGFGSIADLRRFVVEWHDYNRVAADHDGYEVH